MSCHAPIQHSSKKDRTISELRSQLRSLEGQLGEAVKRRGSAQQQLQELECKVQDMEGVLSSNREEIGSMHEQLTEVSTSLS